MIRPIRTKTIESIRIEMIRASGHRRGAPQPRQNPEKNRIKTMRDNPNSYWTRSHSSLLLLMQVKFGLKRLEITQIVSKRLEINQIRINRLEVIQIRIETTRASGHCRGALQPRQNPDFDPKNYYGSVARMTMVPW